MRERLRISTKRLRVWQDMMVGGESEVGSRTLTVQSAGSHAVLRLASAKSARARLELADGAHANNTFSVLKAGSVLRLDAASTPGGSLHLQPGAEGTLRVAGDKLVLHAATGNAHIAGNVSVGADLSSTGAGLRSVRLASARGARAELHAGRMHSMKSPERQDPALNEIYLYLLWGWAHVKHSLP